MHASKPNRSIFIMLHKTQLQMIKEKNIQPGTLYMIEQKVGN